MSAAEKLPTTYPDKLLSPLLNFHLAMDVALGADDDALCDAYELQHHELSAVKGSAIFKTQLTEVEKQLAESGGAFRIKAQAQAEVLLQESFKMATNEDLDPKVRADMIKSNVRWAGFDAPQQAGAGSGGGFQININLGGDSQTSVTYDQEGNPT